MPRLWRDAAVEVRLLVGGDRAGVRDDGPAVVALHVRDDAEIVGAAPDGGHVAVVRGLLLGAREEVGRFVDAAALQRDGAADVQGTDFHHPVLERARPQLRDHRPLLANLETAEAAVCDAVEQGEHGGLFELVAGALLEVRQELGVASGVGVLLGDVHGREVAAQPGGHRLLPPLLGQLADVAFGADPAEDRLGGLGRTDRFLEPSRLAQQEGEIAGRIGLQLETSVQLGTAHDLAQRLLRPLLLVLQRQHQRGDTEVLGFADGVGEAAADFAEAVELAARQVRLASGKAYLSPATQRRGEQRLVPGRLGGSDRLIGDGERFIECTLLAIRVCQVVVALRDAHLLADTVERGCGDFPRGNRFGMTATQVTDDAEVIGGATGRGMIAVAARRHERLRAEIGGFRQMAVDEGEGTTRVQRMALDRGLAEPAGLHQCELEPLQRLLVAAKPRLRDAVEQRQGWRVAELRALATSEELDYGRVMTGCSECSGFIDDGSNGF